MEQETCKICGGEYKRIDIHLRQAHKEITKEEYVKLDDFVPEPVEEMQEEEEPIEEKDKSKISGQKQIDNIFKDSVKSINPEEEPIQKLLDEFMLTYKELRSIIKTYADGSPIDVTAEIERNKRVGVSGAKDLKDMKKVTTQSLHIAEELVKTHGFVTTAVTSNPKTWHLEKR